MTAPPRPPVHLRIDRLVLDGIALDAAGAARFQAELVETLTDLLRSGGARSGIDIPTGTAVPRLAAPAIALPLTPAASPTALGQAVAHSLFAGLGRIGGRA